MGFWNKKENERSVSDNNSEEAENEEEGQVFDETDDILKEMCFSSSNSLITKEQALEDRKSVV